MNIIFALFVTPFFASVAAGQVERVHISVIDQVALRTYCRYGSFFNQDTNKCFLSSNMNVSDPVNSFTVKIPETLQTLQQVFTPIAQAEERPQENLEQLIRRIVAELLPQPQTIVIQGEKGEKGDKGDPGTPGTISIPGQLQAFSNIPQPFWNGAGASGGAVSGGGTTVVNNYYTATSGTSTVISNILTFSTTTGLLISDVGGVVATTTITNLGGDNIYNANGTLTSNRVVDGATQSITFDAFSGFNVNSNNFDFYFPDTNGYFNLANASNDTGLFTSKYASGDGEVNLYSRSSLLGRGANLSLSSLDSGNNSRVFLEYYDQNKANATDVDQNYLEFNRRGTSLSSVYQSGEGYEFRLEPGNGFARFYDTTSIPRGLEYGANYHTTYSPRSLVDKEYVDTLVASSTSGGTLQDAYDFGGAAAGRNINISAGNPVTLFSSGDALRFSNFFQSTFISTNAITANAPFNITVNGGDSIYSNVSGILGLESDLGVRIMGNTIPRINMYDTSANIIRNSIISGLGNPEGVMAADSGSLFMRTNGVTSADQLYIKTTDGGNTGWVAVGGSSGTNTTVNSIVNVNTVLSGTDNQFQGVNTTAGVRTITLPPAANREGQMITIFKTATANFVEVNRAPGDSINFAPSPYNITPQDERVTFVSDGVNNWQTIAQEGTFIGTNGLVAGQKGLVPTPNIADLGRFLSANGTWQDVASAISSSTVASALGFVQNGNSFGANAVIGTNDNFGFNLKTNNTNRLSISNAGDLTILNDSSAPHFGNVLTIQNTAGSHQNRIRFQGVTESLLFGQTISYPRGLSLFSETTGQELWRIDGNIFNSPIAPYAFNMLVGNTGSSQTRLTMASQNQVVRMITDNFYSFGIFEESPGNKYLMTIDSNSNVSFSAGTATHRLTVTDDSTTDVARFNGSGGTQCTVVAGTGWACTSDERLKANIQKIESASDIITGLRAVSYNWKNKQDTQYGFIAQEVFQVLPELVTQNSDGYLSLNTSGLMPFLIKAQQEQIEEIKTIKQQLLVPEIIDSGLVTESTDPIENLTKLLAVDVKTYRMNADTSTSTKQTGFLAQQLETQFPGLVLTSIEGTKSVSYAGMTPILTQAIQTLYKLMADIGVVVEGGVARIGDFFANRIYTKELCIGERGYETCITQGQLQNLLQGHQGQIQNIIINQGENEIHSSDSSSLVGGGHALNDSDSPVSDNDELVGDSVVIQAE